MIKYGRKKQRYAENTPCSTAAPAKRLVNSLAENMSEWRHGLVLANSSSHNVVNKPKYTILNAITHTNRTTW